MTYKMDEKVILAFIEMVEELRVTLNKLIDAINKIFEDKKTGENFDKWQKLVEATMHK